MQDKRHPLSWPHGRPRTPAGQRKTARFTDYGRAIAISVAISRLQEQLDMLRVRDMILSTNVELRLDGLPRSDRSPPADPGVALYFKFKGRETVLACDLWNRVADNIVAIAKHIEALRGQDRWGVGTLEQAFAGYQALPAPGADRPARPWRQVLHWQDGDSTLDDVSRRYRERAKAIGPDDEIAMLELNLARDDAKREIG